MPVVGEFVIERLMKKHCRSGFCSTTYRMGGCECDCELCTEAMMAEEKKEENPGPASMASGWSVGALKPKSIENKTPEVLTKLAKDIAMNLVFTDHHVREFDIQNLGMIFMPLILGAFADATDEYKADIGMIYEYYDKAGPRGVNGYPCFFSFAYINKHDAKIVWEKVWKIKDMLDAV